LYIFIDHGLTIYSIYVRLQFAISLIITTIIIIIIISHNILCGRLLRLAKPQL